jgi:hypothetical protein
VTLTPPEVLDSLRAHGVTARVTAEGRLRIEPVSRLPAELVDAVKSDPSGVADEIRRRWTPEREARRRLLVFRQVASLPTARNLADQHVKYDNFYRIEIRRWYADERALRNEGLNGCVGGDDCVCPPEAPVRCQTCVRSNR